ncbi:uncharacterized protein LOC144110949 [Amblyomma americanum]
MHHESGTADVKPLGAEVKEETDALSNAYVSSIMPDMSTIVQAASDVPSCDGHQHRCGEPSTKKGRSGAALQSTVRLRKKPSIEDTCTVDTAPPGPLGELLPAGTCLRRPSGFLVQHIANVIHNSPRRMLRTSHIYEALRNKFPFYRFVDKDGQATWKSSVRHALSQRWFIKVPSKQCQEQLLVSQLQPRDWTMLEKEEQDQPLETKQALTFARHLGLVPSPARTPPNLEPPRDIRMSSVPTAEVSQLPIVSSQSHEETSTNSPPRVLLARSTQATPKSSPSGFNPLLPTPQYKDTGASCSAAARAEPAPVGICTSLKETPTVNCPGPLPVQEPEARPSSASPLIGTAMLQQTALPSVVGRSREQHQPQAGPQPQPQLQPQRQFVGWPHGNAERFHALHVPSLQDSAQQQTQPSHGRRCSDYAVVAAQVLEKVFPFYLLVASYEAPGDNYSLSWDLHASVGNVPTEDNFYSGRPYGIQSPPRPPTIIHSALRRPELQCTSTDASFVQLSPQREPPLSRQEPLPRRERPASQQELSSQQDRQSLLQEDLLSEHEQPLLRSCRPQQEGVPRLELDAIRFNGRPYAVRNARRSADDPRVVIIECYAALERPT